MFDLFRWEVASLLLGDGLLALTTATIAVAFYHWRHHAPVVAVVVGGSNVVFTSICLLRIILCLADRASLLTCLAQRDALWKTLLVCALLLGMYNEQLRHMFNNRRAPHG